MFVTMIDVYQMLLLQDVATSGFSCSPAIDWHLSTLVRFEPLVSLTLECR